MQSGQRPPGAASGANLLVSGNRYNLRSNNRGQNDPPEQRRRRHSSNSAPVCHYCKCRGYVMSECWALEKKEKNKQKSTIVVKKAESAGSTITLTDRSPLRVSNTDYEPFISQGLVSLVGEENHPQSIHVVRDTGASQSLLLEGILPLSNSSYTGSNVLLQGIVSVPLHVVNLKTNLVSGPVMVGIRPSLPIQGILGNNLAGERVMANP